MEAGTIADLIMATAADPIATSAAIIFGDYVFDKPTLIG